MKPTAYRLLPFFLFLLCFQKTTAQLFINEFMASNQSVLPDEFGEFDDWIEIYNAGETAIDLGGYYISDDLTALTQWQIPITEPTKTTIPPKGFLLLWADKDPEQGPLHVDLKLGASGEAIVLTRADGLNVVDQIVFGEQNEDVSFGRVIDGGNDFQFFPVATPGTSNVAVSLPQKFRVRISKPVANALDDGVQYGSGGGSVNLEGFGMDMVDSWSNQIVGLRFTDLGIPQGAIIIEAQLQFTTKDEEEGLGPCQLLIVGQDADDAENFQASGNNFSNRNRTTAQVEWAPVEWLIRDMASDKQQTPELKNILQEITDRPGWQRGNDIAFFISGEGLRSIHNFESGFPVVLSMEIELPVPGQAIEQIFINEIAPNGTSFADETEDFEDWLELYNENDFPVNVGGLFLSDDPNDLLQWQISESTIIPAKGHLVIWADEEGYKGGLHADFKLSSEGETLVLSQVINNQIVIIDSTSYPEVPFKASIGRAKDGGASWALFGEITPQASNDGAGLYLAPPDISLDNGIYNGAQQISISHPDPEVRIRYTMDASIPDEAATLYDGALEIESKR
ncbi:MAG: lamin tail domain-containing protein [Bacteroidota bacterium]